MTLTFPLHDNHICGLAVLVFCLILRLLIVLIYLYVMLLFLMVFSLLKIWNYSLRYKK